MSTQSTKQTRFLLRLRVHQKLGHLALVLLGGGTSKGVTVEGGWVIRGMPLKQILTPSPSCLFASQLPRAFSSAKAPTLMHCTNTGPRAREPTNHGLEPSEAVSQNKCLFFINCSCELSVTVTGS